MDLLKLTVDVRLRTITKIINLSLRNACFPNVPPHVQMSLKE